MADHLDDPKKKFVYTESAKSTIRSLFRRFLRSDLAINKVAFNTFRDVNETACVQKVQSAGKDFHILSLVVGSF